MTIFQKALQGPTATVFVPIVYRMAARLDQIDIGEVMGDPATAAYVLRNAQSLFELPAIVSHFQLGIELEAEGGTVSRDEQGTPIAFSGSVTLGRATADSLAPILDTAGRLSVELQGRAGVLGVLTGPGTLASLAGASAAEIADLYVAMAKKYSEAHVSAVLLAEAPTVGIDSELLRATTTELVNICRFYRLKSILLAPGAEQVPAALDHVFGAEEVLPLESLRGEAEANAPEWVDRGGLIFSAGEIPESFPPEQLKAWMSVLSRGANGAVR